MPSLRRNIAISAVFTFFGGPALLLLYIPWTITRFRIPGSESQVEIVIASAVILLGLAPLFESIVRFIFVGRGTLVPAAPPRHLVMTGLYRNVRNPMYLGVLTSLAGESLLFRSRGMVEEVALAALAMHLFVVLYEERRLARTFQDEYARYRGHVRRWLPRISPWNTEA